MQVGQHWAHPNGLDQTKEKKTERDDVVMSTTFGNRLLLAPVIFKENWKSIFTEILVTMLG